jgi:hypothetical protein
LRERASRYDKIEERTSKEPSNTEIETRNSEMNTSFSQLLDKNYTE